MAKEGHGRFWDHVTPLLASGAVDPGTVMGHPCVRVRGAFLAMPHHRGPGLVVKLPRERVAELIAVGSGEPFAPAGRAFREWVLVRGYDAGLWEELLAEACAFVGG